MDAKTTITFLGTGTSMGVPVIACPCRTCLSPNPKDKRLRTSIMIQKGETTVVIDSGPDFRQQMLFHEVKHLSALVFTHEHKDHTAGLDDVRAFNFIQNKPVDVWVSERVEAALRSDYHYAFAETRYPGVPEITFRRIGIEPFRVGSLEIAPIEVLHHRLPVYGFKVGGFVYITDANFIPQPAWEEIMDAEVLVLNALRKTPHISHFTLDEAVAVAQTSRAKQCYLTHISHQMGLHDEVNAELPNGVAIAFDGMRLTVGD